MKPEWLQVLQLAFQESLQDKAIAERMNVGERTVRHYWSKIQDVLDVYPDERQKYAGTDRCAGTGSRAT